VQNLIPSVAGLSRRSGLPVDTHGGDPTFGLTLYEKQLRGSPFGSSNPRADISALLVLYRSGHTPTRRRDPHEYTLEDVNQGYEGLRNQLSIRALIRFRQVQRPRFPFEPGMLSFTACGVS